MGAQMPVPRAAEAPAGTAPEQRRATSPAAPSQAHPLNPGTDCPRPEGRMLPLEGASPRHPPPTRSQPSCRARPGAGRPPAPRLQPAPQGLASDSCRNARLHYRACGRRAGGRARLAASRPPTGATSAGAKGSSERGLGPGRLPLPAGSSGTCPKACMQAWGDVGQGRKAVESRVSACANQQNLTCLPGDKHQAAPS